MNDGLANRIRRAYPTGLIYELDKTVLGSDDQDDRIRKALEKAAAECSLSFNFEPFDKAAYSICLTQTDHPSLDDWVWRMRNPQKLAWIKANKQPYPVFWLKISRVADYYYHYFNHWVPRDNTGYLDADFERPPNQLWSGYQKKLQHGLESNGFEYLTDELARERTSLVLHHDFDSIPDDDPRWEDDDFEPPLAPSSVHECLFNDD